MQLFPGAEFVRPVPATWFRYFGGSDVKPGGTVQPLTNVGGPTLNYTMSVDGVHELITDPQWTQSGETPSAPVSTHQSAGVWVEGELWADVLQCRIDLYPFARSGFSPSRPLARILTTKGHLKRFRMRFLSPGFSLELHAVTPPSTTAGDDWYLIVWVRSI